MFTLKVYNVNQQRTVPLSSVQCLPLNRPVVLPKYRMFTFQSVLWHYQSVQCLLLKRTVALSKCRMFTQSVLCHYQNVQCFH